MTRDVARRLVFLLLRASSASAVLVVAGAAAIPACYPGGGGGTDPPTDTFYFPVGLAVSSGGNALYAVNSDFDLQWNGGTLQSYDLFTIRRDTGALIKNNLADMPVGTLNASIPFVFPQSTDPKEFCLSNTPPAINPDGSRIQLGQACSPPVNSTQYVRSSVIIGAFATDLQLQTAEGIVGTRLFTPVRGNASVTWADVGADDPTSAPAIKDVVPPVVDQGAVPGTPIVPDDIFTLQCGTPQGGTCSAAHQAGNTVDALDTRAVTMPGEPFGMAQTQDGTALAVTHQTTTETSLLTAGIPGGEPPSMQFIVTNIVLGGSGITFIPHDPQASVPPCESNGYVSPCVRPAFLETSHNAAEIDLLRYYNDDGSSLHRPFLTKEAAITFTTNLGGTDSRGIVVDPTPRAACKVTAVTPADFQFCAQLPARVFFANRTPPSLVYGQIGAVSPSGDGTYDPDLLSLDGNLPLPAGPSRVYLAPIVNLEHQFEVRVFVVNFDSSTISVYNPGSKGDLALMATINVGPGPFAMAFDPFNLDDVATGATVGLDPRQDPSLQLRTYRFAYVASFTQSYVQVIDLDQSQPTTFENVVFTLGKPTPPKGTQ
jgi:hypothetical protein